MGLQTNSSRGSGGPWEVPGDFKVTKTACWSHPRDESQLKITITGFECPESQGWSSFTQQVPGIPGFGTQRSSCLCILSQRVVVAVLPFTGIKSQLLIVKHYLDYFPLWSRHSLWDALCRRQLVLSSIGATYALSRPEVSRECRHHGNQRRTSPPWHQVHSRQLVTNKVFFATARSRAVSTVLDSWYVYSKLFTPSTSWSNLTSLAMG